MHNLFRQCQTHYEYLEKLRVVIGQNSISVVQSRIKLCNVPSDVGRIPIKVEACIGSLTPDECKRGLVFTRLYRMLVEVCTSMLNHLYVAFNNLRHLVRRAHRSFDVDKQYRSEREKSVFC